MRRLHFSTHAASAVTWLGLALITASFLVLLFTSPAPSWQKAERRTEKGFDLVVLDPGHGGDDSGAMAGGISEKDLTLDVAQRVERLLQAHGLATMMTRTGDSYVSLAERAAMTNRASNAIFVSIHFNDGSRPLASGVETYFAAHQGTSALAFAAWLPFLQRLGQSPTNLQSESLAGFIQEEVVKKTQAPDRGTKAEQFFVLANVRHPAALIEGGFLTNKEEAVKLSDPAYREKLAEAIATGILNYQEAVNQPLPMAANAAPGA